MSLQLLVILGLILATLLVLCAVVTLLLYRRSPKTWYWVASAVIGGIIAYPLYDGLLGYSGLSRPLAFILSLVLAGLLYAVTLLLYRWSGGMSTKAWYVYVGVFVALLLFFALLAFFVPGPLRLTSPGIAPLLAFMSFIPALWQRSRTR